MKSLTMIGALIATTIASWALLTGVASAAPGYADAGGHCASVTGGTVCSYVRLYSVDNVAGVGGVGSTPGNTVCLVGVALYSGSNRIAVSPAYTGAHQRCASGANGHNSGNTASVNPCAYSSLVTHVAYTVNGGPQREVYSNVVDVSCT